MKSVGDTSFPDCGGILVVYEGFSGNGKVAVSSGTLEILAGTNQPLLRTVWSSIVQSPAPVKSRQDKKIKGITVL